MDHAPRLVLIVAAVSIAAGGCVTRPPPPPLPSPPPPAQAEPVGSGAGSAAPTAKSQTAEERRAALDKQLNDSLGYFDAKIRKEQQRIAEERDARQATVAAATTTA